jgi:hypothetical protein
MFTDAAPLSSEALTVSAIGIILPFGEESDATSVEAALTQNLGDAYASLGDYEPANRQSAPPAKGALRPRPLLEGPAPGWPRKRKTDTLTSPFSAPTKL